MLMVGSEQKNPSGVRLPLPRKKNQIKGKNPDQARRLKKKEIGGEKKEGLAPKEVHQKRRNKGGGKL